MGTTVDGASLVSEEDVSGRTVLRRADWLVGKRIQLAREHAGLTKSEAARKAGLNRQTWEVLERGIGAAYGGGGEYRSIVSTSKVITSASEALGLDASELIAMAGKSDADGSDANEARLVSQPRRVDADVYRMYRRLPEPVKATVADLIEHLSKPADDA